MAALGGICCTLRIQDELADARFIAKVDEDKPAVIAAPSRPAGERDRPPDVLAA
jgi:hypothetical protein